MASRSRRQAARRDSTPRPQPEIPSPAAEAFTDSPRVIEPAPASVVEALQALAAEPEETLQAHPLDTATAPPLVYLVARKGSVGTVSRGVLTEGMQVRPGDFGPGTDARIADLVEAGFLVLR